MTERAQTSGHTLADLRREVVEASEQEALEYLLTAWFYRAMESVRAARLRNGLTQEAVAARLGTTQSAVARLENAHRGNFSLDRFLAYAGACGVAPLDLDLRPIEGLRRFVLACPNVPRTTAHYERWLVQPAERSDDRSSVSAPSHSEAGVDPLIAAAREAAGLDHLSESIAIAIGMDAAMAQAAFHEASGFAAQLSAAGASVSIHTVEAVARSIGSLGSITAGLQIGVATPAFGGDLIHQFVDSLRYSGQAAAQAEGGPVVGAAGAGGESAQGMTSAKAVHLQQVAA